MAESKRTFQAAKMNKDIDDRLVQPGTYRDALNVSVEFSEDGNVGALENLKGNEILENQDITGLSSSSNPNAKVIGSIAHPEENKIYYFVTGDKSDGIFEYDADENADPKVRTIIIETSEAPPTPEQLLFKFSDAGAQAIVAINGDITVVAQRGEISSITKNFGATVSSATERKISVKVKAPAGFDNVGEFVYGELTATQQPITAPPTGSIETLQPTQVSSNSVKLNGKYTQNAASLSDIGFYYVENTGGTSSLDFYSNKFVITKLVGNSANISEGPPTWSDPFDTVLVSDITVVDGNGSTVSSSNYTYERYSGPQPSSIKFSGTAPVLPITVAQTSTLTSLTNALTASEIASSGTQISLASTITSPFSTTVSSLAPSTKYAFVSYAVNSSGTSYGDVITFETTTSTYNRLPENKLFIFPTISDESVAVNSVYYPGYGDFEKPDNNFYFAVVASKQSGLYADYDDLRNETGLLSNTGPATLTFNNSPASNPNNFSKTRSEYVTPSTTGMYTITASKTGLTSNSIQIRKGTPSNAVFTSNFTLNFAKTGTGAAPAVAVYDSTSSTALHYNASPIPLASFKIGPFEQSHGNGAIIIPIANVTNAAIAPATTSSFTGFDPTKLDVSITGKTEGTDYNYYIAKEAMSVWGQNVLGYAVPAVVIEADPYVLNGATNTATHTLNITYNY